MNNSIFEYFAELAKSDLTYTQKSGRYQIQKNQEKKIPDDIILKMNLSKKDSLLEIGCGLGNLIIPLAKKTKNVTGIDHHIIIEKLEERFNSKKIKLISGNFLNTKIKKKFNKILIYGVIHCLKNKKQLKKFILKAISILESDGTILIGDIPNIDKKKRFTNTNKGKIFEKKWKKIRKHELSLQIKEFDLASLVEVRLLYLHNIFGKNLIQII